MSIRQSSPYTHRLGFAECSQLIRASRVGVRSRSDQVLKGCTGCSDAVRRSFAQPQDGSLDFTLGLARLPPGVQSMFTMGLRVVRKSFTPLFEAPFAPAFECRLALTLAYDITP